jgi:hypothetical protein
MARTQIEILEDIRETQWCIQDCEKSIQFIETSGNEYIQPGDILRKQRELHEYKIQLQKLMHEEQEATN